MPDIVIELTERVKADYQDLPMPVRGKFKKQLRLLSANPRHPSLRTHPIRGSEGYWEFYIDYAYRCVFRRKGNEYYLIAAGSHCLRHSVAVHYLQGGAPLNVLQSLLGHCHMGTTGRYLQLTDQMAKQIALSTETGLERLLGLPGKDQSTSEARVSYAAGGGLALWDEYMSVVGDVAG